VNGPDFEAMRAKRKAKRREREAEWAAEGHEVVWADDADACYCACPHGPCEHKWDGKPWESKDGLAMSVTCSRCGTTAMSHDLKVMP
jgi:Zn-finger protein